jgi:epoxyqueuosine reductase
LNEKLGSWLFLGVILTSLELTPDLPSSDHCGSCTRCLDACPTHAFPAPYQIDPTKCITYLTVELRGFVPEHLRPAMGRQVFGCDICQDVCPWNRRAPRASLPEFQPRPRLVNPDLEWLGQLGADEFREHFRGSPIKRAKLSGLRRNVVIAMANSGEPRFLNLLEQLRRDEDPVVAEHAGWGYKHLQHSLENEPF